MKALVFAAAMLAAPAFAADVGVSISVGQPGFYGRIDIGNAYPRPVLVYPQAVVVDRVPAGRPPLYPNVPPGHAKHWSRHCREYNACGERVYFVRNDWYEREYVPHYQREHGPREDRHGMHDEGHREHGQGHDHRDHDGHRDRDRDREHGDHRDHRDR